MEMIGLRFKNADCVVAPIRQTTSAAAFGIKRTLTDRHPTGIYEFAP
jgi:hypothetical protein